MTNDFRQPADSVRVAAMQYFTNLNLAESQKTPMQLSIWESLIYVLEKHSLASNELPHFIEALHEVEEECFVDLIEVHQQQGKPFSISSYNGSPRNSHLVDESDFYSRLNVGEYSVNLNFEGLKRVVFELSEDNNDWRNIASEVFVYPDLVLECYEKLNTERFSLLREFPFCALIFSVLENPLNFDENGGPFKVQTKQLSKFNISLKTYRKTSLDSWFEAEIFEGFRLQKNSERHTTPEKMKTAQRAFESFLERRLPNTFVKVQADKKELNISTIADDLVKFTGDNEESGISKGTATKFLNKVLQRK